MENKNTTLLNDHLKSLQGMREASTDEFFYTKLKARMEKKLPQQGWNFPLKPVWIIGTLVFLLIINGIILKQKFNLKKTNTEISPSYSLQNFVEDYKLGI